jgi:hypothetical protein
LEAQMTEAEKFFKRTKFLKRANDCLALATEVPDPFERDELEYFARVYVRLAERAANRDELGAV